MGLQFLIYILPIGPVVLDLEMERAWVEPVPLWSWGWWQDEGETAGWGTQRRNPGGVEGFRRGCGSQEEFRVSGKLGS